MAPRNAGTRYHRARHRVPSLAVAIGAILLLAACEDTKIVEVERPFFPTPIDAAGGMLGYDEIDANLTVCGNCHIDPQNEWEETAHADAWATLEGSGHSQPFCEGCHTVSALGNETTGEVGWTAVEDERFHDVQCESCHGPGGSHVANPGQSQPIASIAVGNLGTSGNLFTAQEGVQGCAECHQGTHHPFVEEWEQSAHGQLNAYPAGRAGCNTCHSAQGALAAWSPESEYKEKGGAPLPLTCAVCHDPHDASNEGQLRWPIDVADTEQNLCARCHNRRTVPDPGSSHGLEPHAPEAALLLGEAGHFFEGTDIDVGEIVGTHGSEANPRLCATCHVQKFEVTDQATGEFVFQSTGHLFEAIPCLGPDGVPLPGSDCDVSAQARSFQGCSGGGCHGSEQAAASAIISASDNIEFLAETLLDLLLEVDPNGDAPGGEIDGTNPTFTVAEGAFFNYSLAHFGDNDFRGAAAHNPFLIRALLIASIRRVEEQYGVNANIAIDYDAEIAKLKAEAASH